MRHHVQGDHITVAAPGQGLNAALNDMGDCVLGGAAATSYATPLVAATAALLAQKYPNESPAMWKYRIESSAQRPLGDTKDAALGWGVLSPYDALTMTLDPNRPGPAMPGHAAPPKKVEREAVGAVEHRGRPERHEPADRHLDGVPHGRRRRGSSPGPRPAPRSGPERTGTARHTRRWCP